MSASGQATTAQHNDNENGGGSSLEGRAVTITTNPSSSQLQTSSGSLSSVTNSNSVSAKETLMRVYGDSNCFITYNEDLAKRISEFVRHEVFPKQKFLIGETYRQSNKRKFNSDEHKKYMEIGNTHNRADITKGTGYVEFIMNYYEYGVASQKSLVQRAKWWKSYSHDISETIRNTRNKRSSGV